MAGQGPRPVSGHETATTIMKIGLVVGIVLILAGGFLVFLNLTGNVTPSFVSARGPYYTGFVQGAILMVVGLVITIILVIGLTGKPDDPDPGSRKSQ